MEVELVDGKLIVKIDVEERQSSSGKTVLLASTHGNKNTGKQWNGRDIYLSLNAYYYPKDK